MRMIDANYVLDALGIFNDREHGDPHFLNGIETACEIIDQAPTVGGWISVKDRLPDKWQSVISCLVAIDGSWKHVGNDIYFGDGRWAMIMPDECEDMKITHWMPMPEPPKEG